MKKKAAPIQSASPSSKLLSSSYVHLIAIAVIIIGIYGKSASYGLTGFDDFHIIKHNMQFLSSWNNIPTAFTTDAFFKKTDGVFYRPLQTLSYIVDAHFGNNSYSIFHIHNFLLLLAALYSIYFLLLAMGFNKNHVFCAIALVAAHPLLVHSGCWLPARGDIQLLFAGSLSFLFFIKYHRENSYLFLVLHFITFLIAVFAKETAALLPLVFLLFIYASSAGMMFRKHQMILVTGWVLIFLIYAICRFNALSGQNQFAFSFITFLYYSLTIPTIPGALLAPLWLNPMPQFTVLHAALGSIILLALCISCRKKTGQWNRMQLFGLVWYILLTLPPLVFVSPNQDKSYDYLEHRALLPMVGLIIAVLTFVKNSLSFQKYKKGVANTFVGISILFAILAFNRAETYANPMDFNLAILAHNEKNILALDGLGAEYVEHENYEAAYTCFDKALEIKPTLLTSLSNRALLRTMKKDFSGALTDLNKVIQARPMPEYLVNRAVVYRAMGNFTAAHEDIARALLLDSSRANTYIELARLLKSEGDFTRAKLSAEQGIAYSPDNAEAYIELADILNNQQNFSESLTAANRAVEIAPGNIKCWINRGLAKNNLHDPEGAYNDFCKALLINPQAMDVLYLRGMVQLTLHRPDEAKNDLIQAARLGSVAAQNMLIRIGSGNGKN
ncbi:MAG: tetratricopeptide repeat protein [Ignavibacteria bacterium]|nr:tetratricopeptide repeat protein [Ignavibacteria bacterium]